MRHNSPSNYTIRKLEGFMVFINGYYNFCKWKFYVKSGEQENLWFYTPMPYNRGILYKMCGWLHLMWQIVT